MQKQTFLPKEKVIFRYPSPFRHDLEDKKVREIAKVGSDPNGEQVIMLVGWESWIPATAFEPAEEHPCKH